MNQAILTVDLGFGDAGKGSIVDYLAREHCAHTVVRYNGGAQAGHRVVTPGPHAQEHVFAQFGSGTFAGAGTHLSRFMLIEPLAMVAEAAHLRSLSIDAFARTTIDRAARVITPFQRAANRLQEVARGSARHGSCGMGIGETVADALAHPGQMLRAGDLEQLDVLVEKLAFLRRLNLEKVDAIRLFLPDSEQVDEELAVLTEDDGLEWLVEEYAAFAGSAQLVGSDYLDALLRRTGTVIFEGAQGVLLDEAFGFHPHTTWSDTTLRNADLLLAEANYTGEVTRIGVTRAYATRHGAGPFVSEDAVLTRRLPDAANTFGAWQQGFRVGWLDLVLLRYACEAVGPLDSLALTCLDRTAALPELNVCTGYRHGARELGRIVPSPVYGDLAYQARLTALLEQCSPVLRRVTDGSELLDLVARTLCVPVGIVSCAPDASGKVRRTHTPVLIPAGAARSKGRLAA